MYFMVAEAEQSSAAAHMDCCPHAEAKGMAKLKEEIRELGQLLGYRTFKQAQAMGVVKLWAEARAELAKAKGKQA